MNYSIQDIVTWYQKKIGTYDKQQWEKSVEQRILSGFTHVPMKTAKLKTEFIDVDLVRGSAFTKTKPKHGLLKVMKLATMRLLMLPLYYNWWICQTSTHIFCFLLLLYTLQLTNTALFTYIWITDDPSNCLENISVSEILAPIVMMLILSITHSHIVSTHVKTKKYAVTNGSGNNSNSSSNNINNIINNGVASNAPSRRIRRTKRRNTFTRSRTSHNYNSDNNKLGCDVPADITDDGVDDNTYNKRNRVKSELSDKSNRKGNGSRNVAWDTTPVKTKNKTKIYKERDDDCVACLETNYSIIGHQPVEKSKLLTDDVEQQIDGVDRIQVQELETAPVSPSLDDDGFESLDSNGSCDGSTREDKDISLSAAEFETVAKINGVPSPNNHNLVNNSFCCPKIINSSCSCNSDNSSDNGNYKMKHEAVTDKPTNVDEIVTIPKDDVVFYDKKIKVDVMVAGENYSKRAECSCMKRHLGSKTFSDKSYDSGKHTDGDNEHIETDDSETDPVDNHCCVSKSLLQRIIVNQNNIPVVSAKTLTVESSVNSSGDESEGEETLSSPGSFGPLLTEGTTSAGEWIGVTTNSEECSYSSEIDASDNPFEQQFTLTSDNNDHPIDWDLDMMPNVILSPSNTATGKVSCTMWEKRDVKKANLSVLDISSAIIARVEAMPENMDYLYIGLVMSVILALIPSACRLTGSLYDTTSGNFYTLSDDKFFNISGFLLPNCPVFVNHLLRIISIGMSVLRTSFGNTIIGSILIIIATFERFCLAAIFFFLLTVAERTFKQRFLYAKFFSHLTSFRRARKSELPHFRLNKVRNIKTWLSVRSYLKKRGPQRSVDVIVSSAFLTIVVLLSFLSLELLKDSEYNVEASGWCLVIGIFMLRFITLGSKINKKYRNLSTIITEQINLYLQIEQKPNKKEELMVANSVLKLAADLLKELESPFKISGFSANPYLYTVTKVVMLSALSGVLSEFLGFKLKLHKIKIK